MRPLSSFGVCVVWTEGRGGDTEDRGGRALSSSHGSVPSSPGHGAAAEARPPHPAAKSGPVTAGRAPVSISTGVSPHCGILLGHKQKWSPDTHHSVENLGNMMLSG